MLAIPSVLLATSGSFRGIIVEPPESDAKHGVIYIKGRNGLVRKVDISAAVIVYGDSVPREKRQNKPESALKSGTDVRVTAEQGDSGNWKASEIEIVGPDDDRQRPVERQKPALVDEHTSVT